MEERAVRQLLSKLLAWKDSHATFDAAVADVPFDRQATLADGLPYSLWMLLEHIRIAQHDILDFCLNPQYEQGRWPDDYWPETPAPPNAAAWAESVARIQHDRAALQKLAVDPAVDLDARIPHGSGQTYLREIVLVADHTAYHVGQIVLVRRLLGIWPGQ